MQQRANLSPLRRMILWVLGISPPSSEQNLTSCGVYTTYTVNVDGSSPGEESWWTRWRKRGLLIGLATVVSAVAGVATWLGWTPWS